MAKATEAAKRNIDIIGVGVLVVCAIALLTDAPLSDRVYELIILALGAERGREVMKTRKTEAQP